MSPQWRAAGIGHEKGQITLPKDISSKLRLSSGDRVTLICEEDRDTNILILASLNSNGIPRPLNNRQAPSQMSRKESLSLCSLPSRGIILSPSLSRNYWLNKASYMPFLPSSKNLNRSCEYERYSLAQSSNGRRYKGTIASHSPQNTGEDSYKMG